MASPDRIHYEVGAVVVPIANPNSHNYDIGKAVIIRDTDRGYSARHRAQTGNHLPEYTWYVRPATVEEIKDLIVDLVEANDSDVIEWLLGLE
jgi:hypothetical protein